MPVASLFHSCLCELSPASGVQYTVYCTNPSKSGRASLRNGFVEVQVDMLLVDKPIKFRAVPAPHANPVQRKPVLQSGRSVIALCNDRCHLSG